MDYKKIYENSFLHENYNLHPNEEFRFQYVLEFVKNKNTKSIIDIGSGRGNLVKILKNFDTEIEICSTDLKKFHDLDVSFFELNLCEKDSFDKLPKKKFELLTCLDVLEHIEKNCVDFVLYQFAKLSNNSILTIANHSDILNGVELHIIQENFNYWKPQIEKYFVIDNFTEYYGGRLYVLNLKSKI